MAASSSSSSFDHPCLLAGLPDELVKHVLVMLDVGSLAQLMRTSRQLCLAVRTADDVWDARSAHEFGAHETRTRPDSSETSDEFSPAVHQLIDALSCMALEDAPAVADDNSLAFGLPSRATPTLSLQGGLTNYAHLHTTRAALRAHLHVIESDISRLPFAVDMIAVPSNEWLENPGFGALQAVYRAAGPALAAYIRKELRHDRSGVSILEAGQVAVTPAFGSIRAKWLIHCVGVNWFGAYQNDALRNQKLREQANLIDRILSEASARGARSVAIPAISTGARRFPPQMCALIIMIAAKRALLERDLIDVYCVSFGPVVTVRYFEEARKLVLDPLCLTPPSFS
mmetsp:Transcript_18992/g.48971  ORF Transcript_18992/g.48971 Transcript_18992/m.48971 type:complete len:342 (+) Transcript_18992:68-1093(+)